jgi:hypothetical protein
MKSHNEETDGKKKATLGVSDLPGTIRQTFTKHFIPLYIKYLAKSKDPWSGTPKVWKLVQFMGELYPALQVDIQGRSQWRNLGSGKCLLNLITFQDLLSIQTRTGIVRITGNAYDPT